MRRVDGTRQDREDAAASLFGFLTATLIFAVSFAAVVQVSVKSDGDASNTTYHDRAAEASSLADLLLTEAGRGWYGASEVCSGDAPNDDAFEPDAVTRFGLGEERCSLTSSARERVANLSFDKLRNLRRASYDSDADNGAIDYQEARESLKLVEAGLDFHLRSWPILPDVVAMLRDGYKDPNLRPLYIGDFEKLQGGQPTNPSVQHVAGAAYSSDAATLYVNITNNGTLTTGFSVSFTVNTQKPITVEKHTGPVAAGAYYNATWTVNKTSDWAWKQSTQKFDYTIKDPSQTVGSGTVTMSGMTHAQQRTIYTGEATKLSWLLSGATASTSVAYNAYDGKGGSVDVNGWTITIRNSADTVVATAGSLNKKGGTASFTLTGADTYKSELLTPAGWVAQRDVVNVLAADFDPFTPASGAGEWDAEAPVPVEAAYVDAVVDHFELGVPDAEYADEDVSAVAGGDVFPDDNKFLADELPVALLDDDGVPRFDEYNVLFMGTNVDHRTLTSAGIKYTIRDWVLAGGTLIVFGSENQAVQWLEPIFHVALDAAGSGVSTPDQSHPILHTPNELDYASYDNHETAWHFNHEDEKDYFSHVVVAGEDDVLAASNPGAFGDGRVILSSWQPYDLTVGEAGDDCDPDALEATCPGLQLLNNFVTLGYSDLYIDYGPTISPSTPQGVQSRIAFVYHPEMHQSVELYVMVYAFG